MSTRESMDISARISATRLKIYAEDNDLDVPDALADIKRAFFNIDPDHNPRNSHDVHHDMDHIDTYAWSMSNYCIDVENSDIVERMYDFVTTFGDYLLDFTADRRDNEDCELFSRYRMLNTLQGPRLAYAEGMLVEAYHKPSIINRDNISA